MHGEVKFYDEATAWGLVLGDDGALYVVRGSRVPGAPLAVGERVLFDPQPARGGPRAAALRRLGTGQWPARERKPAT
jgi:cold shock CspA family protein